MGMAARTPSKRSRRSALKVTMMARKVTRSTPHRTPALSAYISLAAVSRYDTLVVLL